MVRFNEALGATANAAAHPDIDQRARFVRAVLAISEIGTYTGSATLAAYRGSSGYVNVASFPLPFQILFERVALP